MSLNDLLADQLNDSSVFALTNRGRACSVLSKVNYELGRLGYGQSVEIPVYSRYGDPDQVLTLSMDPNRDKVTYRLV